MADGAWMSTANIMALIANVNRDPKKSKRFKASDFALFKKRKGPADLAEAKAMFIGLNRS